MRAIGPLSAAACASAALLCGACGGASPQRDPAASERSGEQKAQAKFVEYARCLREHGIEAEAISHPGGGNGLKINGSNQAREQAAEKACARDKPEPQNAHETPQQKVEQEEKLLQMVRCLRAHGVQAQINPGGEGIGVEKIKPTGSPQANGEPPPLLRRAMAACQHIMGGPPGGGATKTRF